MQIPILENRYRPPLELVIQPGEVGYFGFDLPATAFPREAWMNIRATAAGVTDPAPFGQLGWSVTGVGGAIDLPPGP
jgi:hypothetical protein